MWELETQLSFPLYPCQPSHQRFEVTIEQSICATMAERPVIVQAMDTEQGAASESHKRNSATAGMFSDLTVDV